ncbi:MAG: hypothetical protein HY466_03210 [Deltaproteobacteria bacterium]|nr:hypothetical protein [Deltaproteobacteria bacterium]
MKPWPIVFVLLFAACGSGSVIEQVGGGGGDDEGDDGISLNLSPSEKIYVAAAFFTDPVGSIATVGMNNPYPVESRLAVTDGSDVVVRSFNNQLFVINRGITSTIQVIDPDSLEILGNYSVEPESNPHDLVVANGRAFISRYDANLADDNTDDLWVVNPTSGSFITGINLKPYTTNDGERLARADQMTLVGDFLYVLLQDLSRAFAATTNGKVAVIDTRTNAVVTSIALAGRNPTSIVYHAGLNRLFITDTGLFGPGFSVDLTTDYGGIEVINPDTNETLGILMDDQNFSGYLFGIQIVSETLGVVSVNADHVATFNPSTFALINANIYETPSGVIPELLVDRNGRLWIPERDPANDGMVVIDPAAGSILGGPFPVGALPASLTLIRP